MLHRERDDRAASGRVAGDPNLFEAPLIVLVDGASGISSAQDFSSIRAIQTTMPWGCRETWSRSSAAINPSFVEEQVTAFGKAQS
jgi:hypothetical protein